MSDLNLLAVAVSTVAGFIVSSVYYVVLSRQRQAVSPAAAAEADLGRPPAWKPPLEILRTLVLATVVAGLVGHLGVVGVGGALLLVLALWVGFPAILLSGSVMWRTPRGSSP